MSLKPVLCFILEIYGKSIRSLKGANAQGATTRATSDKIVAYRNNARMKL